MVISDKDLRYSSQIALLGNVTPCMRRMTIWADEETVYTRVFHNGDLSDRDIEAMECILDHLISSFLLKKKEGYMQFDFKHIRNDYPKPFPDQGIVVFQKREKENVH